MSRNRHRGVGKCPSHRRRPDRPWPESPPGRCPDSGRHRHRGDGGRGAAAVAPGVGPDTAGRGKRRDRRARRTLRRHASAGACRARTSTGNGTDRDAGEAGCHERRTRRHPFGALRAASGRGPAHARLKSARIHPRRCRQRPAWSRRRRLRPNPSRPRPPPNHCRSPKPNPMSKLRAGARCRGWSGPAAALPRTLCRGRSRRPARAVCTRSACRHAAPRQPGQRLHAAVRQQPAALHRFQRRDLAQRGEQLFGQARYETGYRKRASLRKHPERGDVAIEVVFDGRESWLRRFELRAD